MIYAYTNGASQCFPLREQELEPPDCWGKEPAEPYEEEYDRMEDEMCGRFDRT